MNSVQRKLHTMLNTPRIFYKKFAGTRIFRYLPDRMALKIMYRNVFLEKLDLNSPKTFNAKLQWLKLYNRRPEYTAMVDKYLVRDYVAKTIGEEYLIPLLGVWDYAEDIDFEILPEQFVLKCNHGSACNIICMNKRELNRAETITKLNQWMHTDYYLIGREWPYKNVPRKIICEKYITDSPESDGLTDYKFFCFNGKVDCVMLCLDRNTGNPKFYFFNEKWDLCRYNTRGEQSPVDFSIPKPMYMDKMFKIARELSQKLPYARIDLYNANQQIYFGEITFFPASGFDANLLYKTDEYFGKLIELEN